MKTAFLCICSEQYLNQYQILFDSVKKYAPDCTNHLVLVEFDNALGNYEEFDEVTNYYSFNESMPYEETWHNILAHRARAVLGLFDDGYDSVVFTGADVEFFREPTELLSALEKHNAVVFPHILSPLPDDGKNPSNAGIEKTGQIHSDIIGWKNTPATREYLEWMDSMLDKHLLNKDLFLDQSWLQFIPYLLSNVCIMRHKGYNVAYYNLHERPITKNLRPKKGTQAKWMVGKVPLVCFHYTGFDVENISKHQNRMKPKGDLQEFLMRYEQKL